MDPADDVPLTDPEAGDDAQETDPEFESAIARNRASFAQAASCWYFSQREFNQEGERSRLRYAKYRIPIFEAFESAQGPVADSYYCPHVPAAAAVTRKEEPKRSIQGTTTQEVLSLHIMDNLPEGADKDADATSASDLLSQCGELSNMAEEDLIGRERQRCIGEIYGAVTDLLNIVDEAAIRLNPERFATKGLTPSEPLKQESDLVRLARTRVGDTAKYYDRMAQRRAQFVYFGGMSIGAAVVLLLASIGWLVISRQQRAIVEICIAAGALGAIMSVLSRVTYGRFRVAYDVGRRYILISGLSRPVVGAVFGLLFYFAIEGGWIPLESPTGEESRFAFFAVAAFVAGYGERFAQDFLTEARSRLAPATITPPPRMTETAEEPDVKLTE